MRRQYPWLLFAAVLIGCGDDATGDPDDDGSGGSETSMATGGGGGAGGTLTTTTGGGAGMGGAAAADTWTNFAGAWFGTYCTQCHPNLAGNSRDYQMFSGVVPDVAPIRCGVTPVSLSDCPLSGPSPNQFPAGNGPKPSAEDRQRIVDWIDAGNPE